MLKLKLKNTPIVIKLKSNISFPNVVLANLQEKNISPKTSEQIIEADIPYDGLSKVTISAVDSSIDQDIVPENIRNDVEILGVTGNVVELKSKPISISENGTYTPEEPYNAYSSVDVSVTPNTSDATALVSDIIEGKSAYVSTGKVTGTLPDCWDLTPKRSGNIDMYIKSIPEIDLSQYTNTGLMFQNCENLIKVPTLNMQNITNAANMFNGCRKLAEYSLINTENIQSFNGLFMYCSSLKIINPMNTKSATSFSQMFYGCSDLTTIPELDATNVTQVGSETFHSNYQLTDFGGLKDIGKAYLSSRNANYSSYKVQLNEAENLTHDSLMNVINKLYDIGSINVQSQQLILGNKNLQKLSADEIQIASDKGWTVS